MTIVYGVGMFTAIVLALVAIILYARTLLVSSGDVTSRSTARRPSRCPPAASCCRPCPSEHLPGLRLRRRRHLRPVQVHRQGGRRLHAADGGVALHAPRCQRGLAPVLPDGGQAGHEDPVPEEVFGVKQWECTVESNPNVATFIKELTLRLPEGESVDFRAGGYVQLECPPHLVKYEDFDIEEEYRGDWERFGFFKLQSKVDETTIRAYSMANYPEERAW
jgi:Na+-transporting NADH:ubiquinone oxidoreductase subunit F